MSPSGAVYLADVFLIVSWTTTEVYGTDEWANPGCRLTDITSGQGQFITGFSVCTEITENLINLENDQSYTLSEVLSGFSRCSAGLPLVSNL